MDAVSGPAGCRLDRRWEERALAARFRDSPGIDWPSTAPSDPGPGGIPSWPGRRNQGARRHNSRVYARYGQDSGTRLALGQRTYQQRTQLSDDAPGYRHPRDAGASILTNSPVVSILLRDGQPCEAAARNLHNVWQVEAIGPGCLPVLRGSCAGATRDTGSMYYCPALGDRPDARHPGRAEAGRSRSAGWLRGPTPRTSPPVARLNILPAPNPAPQLPSKQLDDAHGRRRRRPGSRRR
jgi:hypothetical protein